MESGAEVNFIFTLISAPEKVERYMTPVFGSAPCLIPNSSAWYCVSTASSSGAPTTTVSKLDGSLSTTPFIAVAWNSCTSAARLTVVFQLP